MTSPFVNSCWWRQTNQYLSQCLWSLNEGGRQWEDYFVWELRVPPGPSCWWQLMILGGSSFYTFPHCCLFWSSPQLHRGMTDKKSICIFRLYTVIFLRCTSWWFNIQYVVRWLAQLSSWTHPLLHVVIILGVCVLRPFKTYSLSKCQV